MLPVWGFILAVSFFQNAFPPYIHMPLSFTFFMSVQTSHCQWSPPWPSHIVNLCLKPPDTPHLYFPTLISLLFVWPHDMLHTYLFLSNFSSHPTPNGRNLFYFIYYVTDIRYIFFCWRNGYTLDDLLSDLYTFYPSPLSLSLWDMLFPNSNTHWYMLWQQILLSKVMSSLIFKDWKLKIIFDSGSKKIPLTLPACFTIKHPQWWLF